MSKQSIALERLQPFNNAGKKEESLPEGKRSLRDQEKETLASKDSSETSVQEEEAINVQSQETEPVLLEQVEDQHQATMAHTQIQIDLLLEQHVNNHLLQLEDLLTDYNPETLTKVELTEFTGRLAEIRDKVKFVRAGYRDVMKALPGPDNDQNRQNRKEELDQVNAEVKNHETAVKAKILQLREEADARALPLPREDDVKVRSDKSFADSMLQSIDDQADFLIAKLQEIDDVESKPDNIKRDMCAKRVTFIEDMFKIKVEFNKAKAEIFKETFDEEATNAINKTVDVLTDKLGKVELKTNNRVTILKKLDSDLQLYSTSKAPVATPYPTPKFSGNPTQNLITWLEKMYLAMQDNQIRKNKQVEVLREHLEGDAKKLVPDNVTDWNDAKKLLMNVYGDPKLLWMTLYSKVKLKLSNWKQKYNDKDLPGTEVAMEGIRTLQEFLREAELMGTSDASIQIQFESELDTLCGICPIAWTRKLLKFEGSHAAKLKFFHDVLVDENKLLTKLKINYQKEGGTKLPKKPEEAPKKEDKRNSGMFLTQASSCWFCKASLDHANHKGMKEIGLAGCKKFLFLKSSERLKFVNAEKICRKCLRHKFNPSKTCFSTTKDGIKRPHMCSEDSCERNAVICTEHGKNNVTEDYQKKLDLALGKTFENRANICLGKEDPVKLNSGTMEVTDKERPELSFCVSMSTAMDQLRDQSRDFTTKGGFKPSEILNIPPGEPLFCFVLVEGRTKDHMIFQDSGASNLLCVRQVIKENEFNHVELHSGAIDLKLAGAVTMTTHGEVLLALPLANGKAQAMKATLVEKITESFPRIETTEAMRLLKRKAQNDKSLSKATLNEICKASIMKETGGNVSLLVGQKYAICSPDLIYQDPLTGMGLFRSKYKSRSGKQQYCLAGSIEGLKFLGEGAKFHFYNFLKDVNNCRLVSYVAPRIDNLPSFDLNEEEEEQSKSLETALTKEVEESLEIKVECCCHCAGETNFPSSAGGVPKKDFFNKISQGEKELKKFYEIEASGLEISYRCPKCRGCHDCKKGDIFEDISIKEEQEQHEIMKSVTLDKKNKTIWAALPFRTNPDEALTDNRNVALGCLNRLCNKYTEDVREAIAKAIEKLHENSYILFEDEYTEQIKEKLSEKTGHFICYDAAFSESVSTPVRPVFNASKNTPGGTNLNDCLYRGTPNLTNMVGLLLDWSLDIHSMSADIAKFYNCFKLQLSHLAYQKFLYRKDLNPSNKVLEGVITSLIYGVRSVAAQSEAGIQKICELIKDVKENVVFLLKKRRYVDDVAKSSRSAAECEALIKDFDEVLAMFSMKVKGYSQSGQDPPQQCTKDGVSVTIAGYKWFTKLDLLSLNLGPIHFGEKKRGRLDPETKLFGLGEGKMKTMEEFVPKILTRRIVTSKVAAVFDPIGKVAPVMSKAKVLLRDTITLSPAWDDPIPIDFRADWVKMFEDFEHLRKIYFYRPRVPIDAQEPLVSRLLVGADAGGDSMISGIWIGFKLQSGNWSCRHLIGKTLLPMKSWTVPMRELHSFWMNTLLLRTVSNLLQEFLDDSLLGKYVFGDSRIALAWTIYEGTRLLPFQRHRVVAINNEVKEEDLYHCPGTMNPADRGTKVKEITLGMVGPESVWENGLPWMTLEHEEITHVLKSVNEIKLDDVQSKIVESAEVIKPKFVSENKGFVVKITAPEIEKYKQRMESSSYMEILSPQKFRHTFIVRTYSYVLKYMVNLRRAADKTRVLKGLSPRGPLEIGKKRNTEYRIFHSKDDDKTSCSENCKEQALLRNMYGTVCVVVGNKRNYKSTSNVKRFPNSPEKWRPVGQWRYFPYEAKHIEIQLEEEDLSRALAYIFTATSAEVSKFNDKHWIKKNCDLKEGILIRKGRMMERQEVRVVGGAEKYIDVGELVGINYAVPVLDRYSPWSLSFAEHIHCNVKTSQHRAALSCYRASLSKVYIIKGESLFRKICEDCFLCKRLRRKFYERVMGSPHDSQLTISPLFYSTMVDLVGPFKTYVPSYERVTRNTKSKPYKIHIGMFACVGTGCLNLQVVESEKATGLMEATCRFAMECGTPSIMFPDKQSGLENLLRDVCITFKDLSGQLYKEHGIKFLTCPAQAHWQHGKVERIARTVRESLDREEFTGRTLHILGWQTVCKSIEGTVNDIPIGYTSRRNNDTAETLEVLCPNILKFGRLNARSPQAPFYMPDADLRDYTHRVQELWKVWWKLWQDHHVETLFERQKWFNEGEEVSVGDLVMFKKESSEFGKHFSLGKVDEICDSHDNKIRNVWVRYKNLSENNSRRVQRDIKTIYKILSIEDSTLHQSLEQAWRIADQVTNGLDPSAERFPIAEPRTPESEHPENKTDEGINVEPPSVDESHDDMGQKGNEPNKSTEDEPNKSTEDKPNDSTEDKRNKSTKKKRKSELELLKEWSVKLAQMLRSNGSDGFCGLNEQVPKSEADSMDWTHLYFDEEDGRRLGIETNNVEIIFTN